MTEMTSSNNISRLTRGSLLARNTVLNLIGQSAPLGAAIFAIPITIKELGTDRFGVLTLAWILIGYFSLFDLGLGRALTKLVAEKLGAEQEEEIPALVWTCLFFMMLLGLLGAFLFVLLSRWLIQDWLKIPIALQPETLQAFYLLAFSIPIVISTAGLRAILEAQQRFGLINAIRITMGIFTFLSPFLVLPFSQNISAVVAILAAGRLTSWLIYLLICLHVMPKLRNRVVLQRSLMMPLLKFGGWITLSNIVSPLMVYLDRFLIGALISIAAVAYYVTPYEIVTKLWLVPIAMVRVLFPAFSTSFVREPSRTALLFGRGIKCVFLILFPVTLLIVTLGQEGLDFWLGKEFAQHSTRVLQWLTMGVLINSLAHIPFALVQGAGRPDLTAKLHLVELPVYLFAVWWMIGTYGIEGAAIAWLVRVSVDMVILFGMVWWLLPNSAPIIQRMTLTLSATLIILVFAMLPMGKISNGVFLFIILLAFPVAAWFLILTADERMVFQDWLNTIHFHKRKEKFSMLNEP